jgi:hypothetical protein
VETGGGANAGTNSIGAAEHWQVTFLIPGCAFPRSSGDAGGCNGSPTRDSLGHITALGCHVRRTGSVLPESRLIRCLANWMDVGQVVGGLDFRESVNRERCAAGIV